MGGFKEIVEGKAPKKAWPLWKKLAVLGLVLVIVIPLAVGLGVGLGRKGNSGDDDDGSDDSDDSGIITNNTAIWQPKAGTTWQIVLLKPIKFDSDGNITPDVTAYDIDLYDNNATTFTGLQKLGKKVICYFSAGSWENWRSDKDDFKTADLGKVMDGWPNERWLNTSSENVRKIMKKRIAYAAEKGCNAIDPDNVDGYQNDNGVDLTEDDAIDYVKFLSKTAASYNMSTGLKNAGDIIEHVLNYTHFSVNEQCVEYSECETFAPFIEADKPVFHIEYPDGTPSNVSTSDVDEICSHSGNSTGAEGFSTVIKKLNLDGWVEYCNSTTTYTTEVTSS